MPLPAFVEPMIDLVQVRITLAGITTGLFEVVTACQMPAFRPQLSKDTVSRGVGLASGELSHPEVGYFQVTIAVHQQIGRLQVAVGDASCMKKLEKEKEV
jgi:hypothetical protein